jgi:acetylornithine deacetylase/succinyl-diaminopimelate desuccinylase-like protein
MEIVRELCSFEGRLTGTDAERRAANRLAERLRGLGRRVDIEPTYVHPQSVLVQALHCLVAFAGSLAAISSPAVGFALVLLAATSMYLDLNYRLYLFRALFFRRGSQNVVSPGQDPDAPARLVICAHMDAPRSGALYAPRRARRTARIQERFPVPLGPYRVLFWSMALLLPLLGARMAGVDSNALSVVQLFPTLVLLVGIFLLVEAEISEVVPGGNDNASGVAATVSLAAELTSDPPRNLDVWVVLDGGEECQQEGMRSFVRKHRKEFDRSRTFFLAIDSVGRGDVRFETSAGWLVSYGMDRRLIELCAAIADADAEDEGVYGAGPLAIGSAGDSMPPRLARMRAIGITCRDANGAVPNRHLPTDTPDRIDPDALDRAHSFTLELVRQLDADVGRAAPAR